MKNYIPPNDNFLLINNILIFIKIKHASEKIFNARYRFFFGKISVGIKKRKKEGRKEKTAGLREREKGRGASGD